MNKNTDLLLKAIHDAPLAVKKLRDGSAYRTMVTENVDRIMSTYGLRRPTEEDRSKYMPDGNTRTVGIFVTQLTADIKLPYFFRDHLQTALNTHTKLLEKTVTAANITVNDSTRITLPLDLTEAGRAYFDTLIEMQRDTHTKLRFDLMMIPNYVGGSGFILSDVYLVLKRDTACLFLQGIVSYSPAIDRAIGNVRSAIMNEPMPVHYNLVVVGIGTDIPEDKQELRERFVMELETNYSAVIVDDDDNDRTVVRLVSKFNQTDRFLPPNELWFKLIAEHSGVHRVPLTVFLVSPDEKDIRLMSDCFWYQGATHSGLHLNGEITYDNNVKIVWDAIKLHRAPMVPRSQGKTLCQADVEIDCDIVGGCVRYLKDTKANRHSDALDVFKDFILFNFKAKMVRRGTRDEVFVKLVSKNGGETYPRLVELYRAAQEASGSFASEAHVQVFLDLRSTYDRSIYSVIDGEFAIQSADNLVVYGTVK